MDISIHAPVKGATALSVIRLLPLSISIHAPVKGATYLYTVCRKNGLISIHAPVKGATRCVGSALSGHSISIHAPVKGATAAHRWSTSGTRDFNPRSREGSDCSLRAYPARAQKFQSTLPRRERLTRTVEKGDEEVISIHAPAKGATSYKGYLIRTDYNFNPRSREGSDAFPCCI